jgi:hypothetical protein
MPRQLPARTRRFLEVLEDMARVGCIWYACERLEHTTAAAGSASARSSRSPAVRASPTPPFPPPGPDADPASFAVLVPRHSRRSA